MDHMSARIRLIFLLGVIATSCGIAACPKTTTDRGSKLGADLHLLVMGRPVDAKTPAPRIKDVEAAKAWIDSLLKKKISSRLAKDILVTPATPLKDRHPLPTSFVLKNKGSGSDVIYYLREPCDSAGAVKVKPWWDAEGRGIQICSNDYKPEVKGDNEGRTCGASVLDPRDSPVCGCGPMLVHCLQSMTQFERYQELLVQEVTDTVSNVVEKDLPIETLFTMKETVANEASEYLYRRARVLAGEPAESLFPIPEEERRGLRTRHEQIPGQHAGILTTPFMMYASDALRGVMRNFFDYLWCSGVSRSNVETQAVLALKRVDLRVGDGWKDLAAMNVCTDCHARLDYGMQFFWGYPSSTMGVDFRPSQARTGHGPLYGDNIQDARGEVDLTPEGFAKLSLEQPEFGACMTRKVVDHVFVGTETAEDVERVSAAFQQTHRLKEMLRVALERYALRELSVGPRAPAPSPTVQPAAKTSDGKVMLPPSLQSRLKEHCKECHGKSDSLPLVGEAMTEQQLAIILDQVAFGAMPKTVEGIPDVERRAFIAEVTGLLFADPAERDEAIRYHTSMFKAVPVHRYSTAMRAVSEHGKGDDVRPSATETAVAQGLLGYSPGIALSQAAVAAAVCKRLDDKTARAACFDRATAPQAIMIGLP